MEEAGIESTLSSALLANVLQFTRKGTRQVFVHILKRQQSLKYRWCAVIYYYMYTQLVVSFQNGRSHYNYKFDKFDFS